jgi:GPI mannosyltransferase 3
MSAPEAARATPGKALALIVVLAAALRVAACFLDGPLHPDEYFQYLEPAWWHLTGSGLETWEWGAGLRSWVLPSYHGAWLYSLRALGVPEGRPLLWSLKVHWALLNSALVLVASRGAASITRRLSPPAELPHAGAALGCEGGLLGAAWVAGFPLLVVYGSHTLSELPSMLCLLAGLVWSMELSEKSAPTPPRAELVSAGLIGALLSLGACLRIANAPLALVPPLLLLPGRRYRALGALLIGASVPALLFALFDLATWGQFAGSFIAYLKFNLLDGKAASVFGTEPATFYLRLVRQRLPVTLPLLIMPALLGLRASWPCFVSAALTLGYFSLQPHKEERFIIQVWPLLLIACAGVVGAWLARLRGASSHTLASQPWLRALAMLSAATFGLAVIVDGALHAGGRTWRVQERIDAQGWVGRQTGVTGLLMDYPLDGAGALWFGNPAPHFAYDPALLRNPLVSHVLVAAHSPAEKEARGAGFSRVHVDHEIIVLARAPANAGAVPQPTAHGN